MKKFPLARQNWAEVKKDMLTEHTLSTQLRTMGVPYDTPICIPGTQMPLAEALKDRYEAVLDDYS